MVMPFRRRQSSARPIQSVKHVVDSGGGLTATASVVTVANTVNSLSTPFAPVEVVLGHTVNAMFVIINIIGSTGAPVSGPVDWYIAKGRSGQLSSAFPDPGDTGQSSLRNQIFHEEKGVPGSGDGTPHVFKGVIVLPRGFRRMRDGDFVFFKLKMTTGDTGTFCLKSIYKSYG